ncbi:MAG: twin-arginine translocase TatA/TatE family subunit [Acidobacteriota bacterium]|nr:twin-arginine translocase TatA/TatE family subunit [Acidobacteriota bacterium]
MTILSTQPLLVGPLGLPELLIILLMVLVIFGASKLPLLGKGLGEGIRNFKKGIAADDDNQIEDGSKPASKPAE